MEQARVDPGALLIAVLAVGVGPLTEDGPWSAINTGICLIVLVVVHSYLWPEKQAQQTLGARHLRALSLAAGFIIAVGLAWPIQLGIMQRLVSDRDAPDATDWVVLGSPR